MIGIGISSALRQPARGLPGGAVAVYDFARTNFLNWSEDLTKPVWSNQNLEITSGVSDPFGGNAAVTLIGQTITVGSERRLLQVITAPTGTRRVNSVYLRRRSGTGAVELLNPQNTAWVGQVLTSAWQRFVISGNLTADSSRLAIRLGAVGDEIDFAFPQQDASVAQPFPYEKQTDGQTLVDRSGNNNNGTLGATGVAEGTDPTWTAQGLSFDGVDDFVNTIINADTPARTQVVAFTPNTLQSAITRLSYAGADGFGFGLAPNANNNMRALANVGGSVVTASDPQSMTSGQAAVWAARYGNNSLSLFRNAMIAAQTAATGGLIATTNLSFGAQVNGATPANIRGIIHYAALYPRALSDAEVAQAYRVIKRTLAARGVALP